MSRDAKNRLLRQNTLCWVTALILPVILHIGLANSRLPFAVILPLLLLPAMLASNSLLSKAAGEGGSKTDAPFQ